MAQSELVLKRDRSKCGQADHPRDSSYKAVVPPPVWSDDPCILVIFSVWHQFLLCSGLQIVVLENHFLEDSTFTNHTKSSGS